MVAALLLPQAVDYSMKPFGVCGYLLSLYFPSQFSVILFRPAIANPDKQRVKLFDDERYGRLS